MKTATAVKDPVCGMDVDVSTAAAHSEHNGQSYHFCGAGCKKKFDLAPEQYSGPTAKPPTAGKGCCS